MIEGSKKDGLQGEMRSEKFNERRSGEEPRRRYDRRASTRPRRIERWEFSMHGRNKDAVESASG
jgi:hypothetical protein